MHLYRDFPLNLKQYIIFSGELQAIAEKTEHLFQINANIAPDVISLLDILICFEKKTPVSVNQALSSVYKNRCSVRES